MQYSIRTTLRTRTPVPRLPLRPPTTVSRGDGGDACTTRSRSRFSHPSPDRFASHADRKRGRALAAAPLALRQAATIRLPQQHFDSPAQLAFADVLRYFAVAHFARAQAVRKPESRALAHVRRVGESAAVDESRRALRTNRRRSFRITWSSITSSSAPEPEAERSPHVWRNGVRASSCSKPAAIRVTSFPAITTSAFHALECENDGVKWDLLRQPLSRSRCQRALPARPHVGRLHCAQRHDLRLSARRGLGSNRQTNVRRVVVGEADAALLRAAGEVLVPVRSSASLSIFGINPSRHGFRGWLRTELPRLSLLDSLDVFEPLWREIALEYAEDPAKIRTLQWIAQAGVDANDWRLVAQNSTGVRSVPLTTARHRRIGARERLRQVQRRAGKKLRIELDALASRVLFEGARAVGVEYLCGGERQSVRARRDVVSRRRCIQHAAVVDALGDRAAGSPAHDGNRRTRSVGRRREQFAGSLRDWCRQSAEASLAVLSRSNLLAGRPAVSGVERPGSVGVYTTNGAALALARCSSVAGKLPSVLHVAACRFSRLLPGFSRDLTQKLNYMTWVVLKAHTRNGTGTVRLRSCDPRDPPDINFNYFEEGGDADLRAMVEGVKHVRGLGRPLRDGGVIEEELPGPEYDTDEKLGDFIRANAWGHHASCTCPIGAAGEGGVLSGDFRVHGVERLRVVDASVFPRIPGFFIASATYMIAEKAADVMLSA